MSDYISREKAKAHIGNKYINILLDEIPSADVRENIHGEWIDNENGTFTCNKCGEISCCNGKFCCECGADMRGE